MAIGFVVGVVFAALDLSLNRRNDGGGGETLKRLVKHLFGSLVVAILFIIVSTGVKELLWNGYGMHRRYHAYPPDMELLNAFRFVPVLALAGAFLWAMNKSLRHP